ncbi:hypothetical protein [Cognatiluteimonas weifangensis]|uniref:hypothetical protein n=1 Tax=Cognatiluteimonas weifangensis TaxID=2303539 RepID=UPI001F37843A|nr:hypothetical protein [Luteimonas weifangensis]
MAFALFAELVNAYELDENSKASPNDADRDRVAMKAFQWADAFNRMQRAQAGRKNY